MTVVNFAGALSALTDAPMFTCQSERGINRFPFRCRRRCERLSSGKSGARAAFAGVRVTSGVVLRSWRECRRIVIATAIRQRQEGDAMSIEAHLSSVRVAEHQKQGAMVPGLSAATAKAIQIPAHRERQARRRSAPV